MTVFRGYMLLIKRNLSMLFMYTGIFVTISLLIQFSRPDTASESFSAKKLDIVVIDKDDSVLSKGIEQTLKKSHNIKSVKQEEKVLQEAMFYGTLDYVVEIPQQFEEKFVEGKVDLPVIRRPGQYTSAYADQQINQFLNQVKSLYQVGHSMEEAVRTSTEALMVKTKVAIIDTGYDAQISNHSYMFMYFPYLYLSVLCYSMGVIIIIFKGRNIRRRNNCSSVSMTSHNIQSVMAYGIISISFWIFTLLLPAIMHGKALFADPNLGLYCANSFALVWVTVGIAMIVGAVAKNIVIINAIINVVSLGMCFMCGVFVPMSMLSKQVEQVSQFLPVYWYVKNNTILGQFADLTKEMRTEIWQRIGIQMLFAAAFISAALVINKMKSRSEK